MDLKDYYTLGYISKTVGIDNRIMIVADTDAIQRYKNMESFFVDLNGTLTPFFVRSTRVQPPSTIVAEVEDLDQGSAELLIGKEVYMTLSSLPPLKGKKFYFHEVIGFAVKDKTAGIIGTITSVFDRSTQPVFQVLTDDKKEILVPITEHFISSVNREEKILEMDLPEGLIDLYLGSGDAEDEFS
jgi:16S rRNA processing protein RimM